MGIFLDLLECPRQDGFPPEYLLARLGCREDFFAERCQREGWENSRQLLAEEFRWLFVRMNWRFRAQMAPVLFSFELRTLALLLRLRIAGSDAEVSEVAARSLLAANIREVFSRRLPVAETLSKLAAILDFRVGAVSAFSESYRAGGAAGVERELSRSFRQALEKQNVPGPVRLFLADLLVCRNLLLAAKHRRWGLDEISRPNPAAATGQIEIQRLLRRVQADAAGGKRAGLLQDPLRLEEAVREVLARVWRRSHGQTSLEALLGHLWRLVVIAERRGEAPGGSR